VPVTLRLTSLARKENKEKRRDEFRFVILQLLSYLFIFRN